MIGQKNTKVFWHQSEARITPAVWNWSVKSLSPGDLLRLLDFFSPKFFLTRLDFFPPPLTAPGSPRMDRSMRSGTKLAREIQLTDWSTAGNLSNRSSGVQIPRDICTRFWRYLYSTKCSWILNSIMLKIVLKHKKRKLG